MKWLSISNNSLAGVPYAAKLKTDAAQVWAGTETASHHRVRNLLRKAMQSRAHSFGTRKARTFEAS
jgi:hypothetical protein